MVIKQKEKKSVLNVGKYGDEKGGNSVYMHYTYLWKYSLHCWETALWITPIASVNWIFTSGLHFTSKFLMKWVETSIKASVGHDVNQSIVHPDIRPGNFKERFWNLSPT